MKKVYVITGLIIAILLIFIGVKVLNRENTDIDVISKNEQTKLFVHKIGETDMDKVWCGSFQIAWNELMEYVGGNVEFENEENEMADRLNSKSFTKDMISEDDYYTCIIPNKTGLSKIKEKINSDLKNKFGTVQAPILDKINEESINGVFIYSTIKKNFEFPTKFDYIGKRPFYEADGSSKDVEYFGIKSDSDEALLENVEIMYCDEYFNSYIVKLYTQENEEIMLYKTDKVEGTPLNELYEEVLELSSDYTGNKKLNDGDTLQIPYINLNFEINYDELCGKEIKGRNGEYIAAALQNIMFSLDDTGAKIEDESAMDTIVMSIKIPYSFDDDFVIFIKEQDKEKPYFATKILNIDFLKTE